MIECVLVPAQAPALFGGGIIIGAPLGLVLAAIVFRRLTRAAATRRFDR